ncbi:General transcription factor 3C polypeptide 3 (Transcription factor IIIC 102 kDa subunit) (TFIIIC 102 kDa subunit) (TFIIIC102) (Transcription factor IIIC subunit gamma) (TF3C-gamma) [Durusdinium trenchii]|uniref:General transcription factor 3C polypeptide 3 (Transcription factor IIIC 102 kDa subunit) (TFIIIC 102 kDa subunit) (TFIIIC102) (Transcription factor IIIC subunit gamma) (TF3C-gamma) n=1 Tax=Durusdinium trenchii TaxID=1381693 RepID=A0ABP0LFU7_9DINO
MVISKTTAKQDAKGKAKAKVAAKVKSRKSGDAPGGGTVMKKPALQAPRMRHRRKEPDPAFDAPESSPKEGDRPSEKRGRGAPGTAARKARRKKDSPEKPDAPEEAPGSGGEKEQDDSDFNSSDLDPVLWAVGGQELEESGKMAERMNLRRENKKKRLRKQQGPKNAVQRARENCQATPEARALLARGQAQYAAGEFADAIETMKAAVREQPGLADPYHVLHLIYNELGDGKKALDALLLSAYFTSPPSEAHHVWRKVADLSLRVGQTDQACYAFKRCIAPQGSRTEDDWKSLWQLSQLLFKKERTDRGIQVLFELYEETQEPKLACEVAKKLVQRHRWKECLALLEACVARGRQADPPRIDLNILNILAEVLMELRDFEKCATLLKELLHLTPQGGAQGTSDDVESTALALIPEHDTEALMKRLHNSPVDLVAKLGAALCQIPTATEGDDPCCKCAIEVVLSHSAESHHDLYLVLVDAMLADASTTADTVSQRWRQRAHVRPWFAEQASRLLDQLESCSGIEEDLRERKAMCNWRLGKVEEAAIQLEELLEDPGDRTEVDLRNLRVRAAEAWIELGCAERADQVLSTLTYEELQRSHVLPPAMSAAERKNIYKELTQIIDATMNRAMAANDKEHVHHYVGSLEELKAFIGKFRHLVYDCELDYKRLSAHSANLKDTQNTAAAPVLALEDAAEEAKEAKEAETDADGSAKKKLKKGTESTAEAASDATGSDALALVVKPNKAAPQKTRVLDESGQAFTSYRWKRKHLGLDSIEDMFGFEAYLELVKLGVEIIRSYSASAKTSQSREGIIQAARAVELCEMIITNRRLVSVRNPVKRRLVRDLAMTSLCTGVDARLWKVVFKHLRLLCDSNDSDHLLALFSRILFTHADVEGLSASPAQERADAAPWDHQKTGFSASGHRNTYAAAFTDVRGWALRRLLRRPRDFGLTLLCAHFCIIASQYPYAVAEYSRAHRLAPFEPLPALCTATAYISFSMSRAAVWRHDLVLKGLTFLQRYRRLRLRRAGLVLAHEKDEDWVDSWGGLPPERQPWEENVLTDPMDHLAIRAEVAYNYGRAFHQLSMSTFAVEAYEAALSCFEGLSPPESQRTDLLVIRRSTAWNLAYLYKAQGTMEMAADVLWRHVVW